MVSVSAVHAGEVKNLMKTMKQAQRDAMDSQSMPDFAANFAKLQDAVRQASKQKWSNDQATFDEGQQKLQKQLDVVAAQVAANNLSAAKLELEKTNALRKEYHKKLD